MRANASPRGLLAAAPLVALLAFGAFSTAESRADGRSAAPAVAPAVSLGGPLPGPLPLFPPGNWWNLDISAAPVDSNSAAFISFIGINRSLHPDFGGTESPGSDTIYGMPYVVVDGTQPKKTVQFEYSDESDGVNHTTDTSFPFYPIPDEAITQRYFIEGGPPGNQNVGGDRHMLIVDRDNKHLYELYALRHDGTTWRAGSGAFFDLKTNDRRPETWTSADAAGLAILPGLVRYDEVFGPDEINHAFRVTLRASNGYVFPASHAAGNNPSALPMGARLRLKESKNISSFPAPMQKIFRAMKKYGLIMADNGSDMYISGTFNTSWDNDVLNPAFAALKASDFEVIQRGYTAPTPAISIANASVVEGHNGNSLAAFTLSLSAASAANATVQYATANGTATAGADYNSSAGSFTISAGTTSKNLAIVVRTDTAMESDETFTVTISNPIGAVIGTATATGVVVNDDPGVAAVPVTQYRLYHDGTKEHLYTTDLNEYNVLGARGWTQEGVAYKMLTNGAHNGVATIPLFRLYHPGILQHHWTTDSNEATTLGASTAWFYEGTIGYLLPTQVSGSVALYRMALANPPLHLWTTDLNEYTVLATRGWVQEGIVGHVVP
jgi:hypothetical protein